MKYRLKTLRNLFKGRPIRKGQAKDNRKMYGYTKRKFGEPV